eukprot:2080374-Prymnesium_polylepis.1
MRCFAQATPPGGSAGACCRASATGGAVFAPAHPRRPVALVPKVEVGVALHLLGREHAVKGAPVDVERQGALLRLRHGV